MGCEALIFAAFLWRQCRKNKLILDDVGGEFGVGVICLQCALPIFYFLARAAGVWVWMAAI